MTIAKIPNQVRLIITSNLLGFSSLVQIDLRPKIVHLFFRSLDFEFTLYLLTAFIQEMPAV